MRPAELALVAAVRADLKNGRVRAARKAAGMSGAEVARALGVSRQSVSDWETGGGITEGHALAYGRLLARLGKSAA